MASPIEVKVPDIGDFKEVEVIEVLVKAGDAIDKEQSLVTLESDKATMEIPSPEAGVVKALKLKVGDKVSEGALILLLEAAAGGGEAQAAPQAAAAAAAPPVTAAEPALPDGRLHGRVHAASGNTTPPTTKRCRTATGRPTCVWPADGRTPTPWCRAPSGDRPRP